jgi:chitin-binding protein
LFVLTFTALFSLYLWPTTLAEAHGTMESPVSRIYQCRFVENPENPSSAACRDAVAIGGTQPLYDWNEVNIGDAAGNHRQRIPDGRLCSAGRDKYRGFDQARADWPATQVSAGAPFGFRFLGSAPHQGTIELYITRDGYLPTRPLRWDDLEDTPFLRITEHQPGGAYAATANMPSGKSGRHLIYAIWQRSDSPEAFYSCSDVEFGGAGRIPQTAPEPTGQEPTRLEPTHSSRPTQPSEPPGVGRTSEAQGYDGHDTSQHAAEPSMPAAPAEPVVPGAAAEWQPNVAYTSGAQASFGGRLYQCRQAHTSLPGWEPTNTPALWLVVSDVAPGQVGNWEPQVQYEVGAMVVYNGRSYLCQQAHISLPGWDPESTPALWQPTS